MKRLLAYSSIENIGIIVAGIGLAILFRAYDKTLLAAVALTAVLYHCLNHAFFKSLLFLATGSVLHATHERSLGKLGGLIHRMPWVAWLALVGTLAIAGLPPLNGFVSEWLLLQAFLFTPTLPQSFVNMLVPVATAALVLAVALSRVRDGEVLRHRLPRPPARGRTSPTRRTRARSSARRSSISPPAASCSACFRSTSSRCSTRSMRCCSVQASALPAASASNWLLLAPINADRSSYSPLIVLVVIVAVVLLTMQVVHRYYHGRIRTRTAVGLRISGADAADAGHGGGLRPADPQVFEPFFRIERHLPSPFDAKPRYAVKAEDPSGTGCTCRSCAVGRVCSAGSSGKSSRGASRCTSRTASSRCSPCCSSCDERCRPSSPSCCRSRSR